MSSLNRDDYRRLFVIGLSLYAHRSEFTQRMGVEIMDMVESVVGQQQERPAKSRRSAKVSE